MTTKPISLLRSFAFISLTTIRVFAGNALENYVQQPDKSFEWKVAEQKNLGPMNITHATLTSQTWRTNVWTHHLQIVRPEKVRHPEIGFLFITGDGTGTRYLDMLTKLADRAGAVAAVVTRVPNQPRSEEHTSE